MPSTGGPSHVLAGGEFGTRTKNFRFYNPLIPTLGVYKITMR